VGDTVRLAGIVIFQFGNEGIARTANTRTGAAGSDYLRQIRSANDAALINARATKLMSLAMSRARTNTPAPGS